MPNDTIACRISQQTHHDINPAVHIAVLETPYDDLGYYTDDVTWEVTYEPTRKATMDNILVAAKAAAKALWLVVAP